jgi:hypothetical protein
MSLLEENFDNINENFNENTVEKKKRGRKRKEDILKQKLAQQEEEAKKNIKQEVIDPSYYSERNEYKNILLASFLTRWRSINYNHIKDNDNIITDGMKILEEVKKMSDIEYGTYYKLFLRNINREDIFEANDYFF